ncbi:dolichyl-phosphate-mannose--protein O-mannosyl transferase [Actinoplanes octamycinicus]|uniref:Polyprenol-phosphate-mannose--protein mannosyltransferase n=1 Tax=Actinoplanes octamycinicus TaxID=135948 RepID=A0A7W7H4I9_9ACTN|nr:phospholipid carrier-dependent glycosyltransferase [Actinoplanes octamycinicus]MBB4743814.1 dolichyl-phosphate-mannose--protein O-mannosyl transferase [Actinoplanes octamycinicus]GIE58442.1 phospholipid carrier-dependent glycosyltransferase [Actinoplanes octamycinicus]
MITAVPDLVRRRLSRLDGRLDPYSWLVTGVIVTVAAILRLSGITYPKKLIFDEIYYPTDAWDMLQHGVEWDEKTNGPGYVVHPPLGKWLIALGEKAFGNTELGWRFPAAVAGTLMILILIRVAYRLFHSIVLAGLAGLLMTLDGFQLVLSRTSLLDIFLGLFILATFAAMVLDRDHYRRSLLRALETGIERRIVPWWLLAAGILYGLACGVKWSALFFLPVFAGLIVVWRVRARSSAGRPFTFLADLGWGLTSFALAAVFYLATWTGWLVTDTGFYRHWRADNGMSEPPILGALLNLWHYHSEAYTFHSDLTKPHRYQSWPWQWLLLGRPVPFDFATPGGCGAAKCAQEIVLLGTPILWWSFLPALLALIWLGIARRDWRAYAIVVSALAGLLPWFYYAVADSRTMFSFYVLPALPFLILAVVYVLGVLIAEFKSTGITIAAVYVVAVALCFAYFWPIFVDQVIPYDSWWARMWLGTRWV